ncbi:hypothetical protein LINPERHAP1_LOCUS14067 [Linum perenne]
MIMLMMKLIRMRSFQKVNYLGTIILIRKFAWLPTILNHGKI